MYHSIKRETALFLSVFGREIKVARSLETSSNNSLQGHVADDYTENNWELCAYKRGCRVTVTDKPALWLFPEIIEELPPQPFTFL